MKLSLFAELRRRNVFKAGAAYLALGWIVVQITATLVPALNLPSSLVPIVTWIGVIGFPFVIMFSWIYELTPEGLKRESEVDRSASITHGTNRRLDHVIIGLLVLAIGLFAFDRFVPHRVEPPAASREAQTPAVSSAATASAASAAPAASDKSIAVLPFINMSGDPKNEYFSDGITEEILNALAQIADLKVAARSSAFAFKGKEQDLRKVGEILAVATVLEGSVQRSGDDVRITAQLIDARSGFHLWSEKYDRKVTNLFAVEDEISKAIADKLQLQLAGAHATNARNTSNTQAHELYLRGLTLIAARGPGLHDAIEAFREAVKLDPQYAQAWGALAEAEILLPTHVPGVLKEEAMQRAESAAQRALAIDPGTASAHVALGEVYEVRREWPQAERSLKRALELAPGDAEAIDQYAQFLCTTGQLEPALRQIDRARQLDPLSANIGQVRAWVLMGLRRDDDAAAQLEAVVAAHPDFVVAHWTALLAYAQVARFAEAESHERAAEKSSGLGPGTTAVLVRGMAVPADRAAAVRSIESFIAANPETSDEALDEAILLSLLGERDKAVARIEVVADRPGINPPILLWVRALDPLRDDPRFQAALKKMNLPYPATAGSAP